MFSYKYNLFSVFYQQTNLLKGQTVSKIQLNLI